MHRFALRAAIVATATLTVLGADLTAKRRVAVLDFDNAAAQKSANPYYQAAGSNAGKPWPIC